MPGWILSFALLWLAAGTLGPAAGRESWAGLVASVVFGFLILVSLLTRVLRDRA